MLYAYILKESNIDSLGVGGKERRSKCFVLVHIYQVYFTSVHLGLGGGNHRAVAEKGKKYCETPAHSICQQHCC